MNTKQFSRGLRVGVPISLGYLAVSFTLGITAKNAGLSAFQATLTSLLVNASAGQYAAFTMMAAQGGYWEIAILEAVTNAPVHPHVLRPEPEAARRIQALAPAGHWL